MKGLAVKSWPFSMVRDSQKRPEEQFLYAADSLQLQLQLAKRADQIDETIRRFIISCYEDQELASYYQGLRNSGIYEKGAKQASKRKLIEFPNGQVYDFVKKAMTEKYGPDWLQHKKYYKDDLVAPWLVVRIEKL